MVPPKLRLANPIRRRRAQKSLQSRFVRCADSTGLYTVTTLMSTPDLPSEVSELLEATNRGEPQAAKQLLPLVYDELRRLARSRLAREAPGQTLDATALVHEAYLRLVCKDPDQPWDGREHFFAAAAEAMRRILVENARRKHRSKHGGDLARAISILTRSPNPWLMTMFWRSTKPSTALLRSSRRLPRS